MSKRSCWNDLSKVVVEMICQKVVVEMVCQKVVVGMICPKKRCAALKQYTKYKEQLNKTKLYLC